MFHIATELIGYQNQDKFPERLAGLIASIYDRIDKKEYRNNDELVKKAPEIKQIEDLIKDRFNLNMPFDKELHAYVPAAVIPFLSDYLIEASSVRNFSSDFLGQLFGGVNIYRHIQKLDKEKEAYFKRIHNRRGFVDRKSARVGGYLADVKNYLILDFFFLKDHELTPMEAAAVTLHEIGHAYTGLETHHRLTQTNSTIMDIMEDINKNKRDKAFYKFKRYFNQDDLESAALGSDTEIHDFYGKLANTYLTELSSQMGNYKYDQTNFENLADSFATRFNLGRELTSGLHKLHTRYGIVRSDSLTLYATLMFIDLLLLTLMLVVLGPVGIALAALMIMTVYNQSMTHMTYDFPLDRYNRIKNSIVNNLKNQQLPKELVKDLIDQYLFIDEVIDKSMHFKEVLEHISDWINFSNRENNHYIHVQQTIENNLNSVLFVKSAQLRTLE